MHALLIRAIVRLGHGAGARIVRPASALLVLSFVALDCTPAPIPVPTVEWRFRDWENATDEQYLELARHAVRACGHDPECFEVTLHHQDELRLNRPRIPHKREAEFRPIHCRHEYPVTTGPLGGPEITWSDERSLWTARQRGVVERAYGEFRERCPDCPERLEDLYLVVREDPDRLLVEAYVGQPFKDPLDKIATVGLWAYSKDELDWPFRARVVFVKSSERSQ